MKQYYYSNGQEQFGPFSFENLKEKNITEETLIWFEGLEEWTSAKNIKEIAREILELSPPPLVLKIPENSIHKLPESLVTSVVNDYSEKTNDELKNILFNSNKSTTTEVDSAKEELKKRNISLDGLEILKVQQNQTNNLKKVRKIGAYVVPFITFITISFLLETLFGRSFITDILNSIICSASVLVVGYYIAPENRNKVVKILLIILIVCFSLILLVSLNDVFWLLQSVSAIVTTIITYLILVSKKK